VAFFIRIFILVVTLTLPSFAISKKKWTADKCKVVLNYVQKPYKNLYKNLLRKNKKKIKSRYKKLLRMDDFLCDDSKERAIVMRFMEDVLSVRNNKVALMSQLGGDINTASHSITTSMQSYIKSHNSNVQLSVMDTGYDYKSFMKQLAYAVMVLDVNFVVLGPGRYSVHQAKKTLHQLRLPTLVLSNDKGSFVSKYSFHEAFCFVRSIYQEKFKVFSEDVYLGRT